jgi:hypothetical protein
MEGKESHDEYGHEFFLISAFWFLTEIKTQITNTRKLSFLMFPIPKIDVNIFSSSFFNFSLVIVSEGRREEWVAQFTFNRKRMGNGGKESLV